MALKGDRKIVDTDISFFMNEVSSRGCVVVYSTVGSGAALDQSAALVTVTSSPSGKAPAGLLLNDMVDIDQTRQHINFLKDEMIKGSKVTLLTRGEVLTDQIVSGTTPAVGNKAYLGPYGRLTPTQNATPAVTPFVGEFLSSKDEDGYCKVRINLPAPAL